MEVTAPKSSTQRPFGRMFPGSRGRGRKTKNWRQPRDNSDADDNISRSNEDPTPRPSPTPAYQRHPVQQQPPAQPARPQPPPLKVAPSEDGQEQEKSVDSETTPAEAERSDNDMRRILERANPRRHYTPEGWNVKVVCNSFEWHLHKYILRKCNYFSAFLPVSQLDKTSTSVIELHDHCPGQLASVLRFMYFYDYPSAEYDPSQPLYGDSLLTNTAMYVAGASVGHQGLMEHAKRHIKKWSIAVLPALADEADRDERATIVVASSSESPLGQAIRSSGQMDYAILRLADPLLRSLTIVYEQPLAARAGPLFNLRLVLVRFVAAALPFLAVNAAFRAHFRNEWERPLSFPSTGSRLQDRSAIDDIIVDYAMFSGLGRIGWQKLTTRAAMAHSAKDPGQPSLARTFALLQRLCRNERSWTNKAPNFCGDEDSDVDDRTIVPEAETKIGTETELEDEAEAVQKDRKKYWEASLLDHEKTMGELLRGLESILAGEMSHNERGRERGS